MVYSIYKTNLARTNGFTTFPKITTLIRFILATQGHVVKPLVLATLLLNMPMAKCFSNCCFGNVVKPMCSITLVGHTVKPKVSEIFLNIMLLEHLVL